jgi:hypothetical protein
MLEGFFSRVFLILLLCFGEFFSYSFLCLSSEKDYPLTDKFFPFEMKKELFFDQFVSDFFEAEEPLGLKRQVHDLDSIRHSSLWQDWDVSRKVIDIYQARMNIISAVGHLLPRFSAGVEIAAKVKFTNSLENLFGFVIPFNWFILFQGLNLLGAERYALMDMLLDEYTLSEIRC